MQLILIRSSRIMLSVLSETFINSAIIFAVFGVRRASGLHALEPAATQIKMFDGTASPATTLHTSTAATPTPTRPPSDATWTEQHCARAIPTLLVQCSSDTFTENVTRGLIPLKLESCADDTHTLLESREADIVWWGTQWVLDVLWCYGADSV